METVLYNPFETTDYSVSMSKYIEKEITPTTYDMLRSISTSIRWTIIKRGETLDHYFGTDGKAWYYVSCDYGYLTLEDVKMTSDNFVDFMLLRKTLKSGMVSFDSVRTASKYIAMNYSNLETEKGIRSVLGEIYAVYNDASQMSVRELMTVNLHTIRKNNEKRGILKKWKTINIKDLKQTTARCKNE